MEDKLTKQDKKFIKKMVETGNKTKSVQEAYGIKNEGYASVKGQRLMRKDKIQNAIKSIAESLPDEDLIKVHKQGLKATWGKKPDFAVRHKYLDSAYKLKNLYETEKGGNNINIQVNILNYVRNNPAA